MRIREIVEQAIAADLQSALDEGKRYPLGKRDWVRIDQPTHGAGQPHAHTPAGVVNKDGTASHKSGPFRLSKRAHDFLLGKGFELTGRLIESGGSEMFEADFLPTEAILLLRENTCS